MQEFTVRPQPDDPRLTRTVAGIDQEGRAIETAVVMERPLTLFLNGREIVTMMTIGDHPDYLAVGYLLNQNMLRPEDRITGIDYDDELETVVVRTDRETDFEDKLRKKTLTSGCAQGTVFGDLMEKFEEVRLDPGAVLRTSWLYALTRKINTAPSLYLAAGAIHGCVLCEEDRPLLYMEDVGRHNAIDKIAGYMHLNHISPRGQDLLHDRSADLRDGDQDRADGHPDPDLALGLYRLGGRPRAPGRAHPDRPRQGQAVRRARRRPSASSSTATSGPSRTSIRGSRARRASPRMRREGRRAAARGRAVAAHGRRRQGVAPARRRFRCSTVSSRGCGRRSTALVLNANGDPARFAALRSAGGGRQRSGFRRPARRRAGRPRLGGAQNGPDCPCVVSVATDAPFLPRDLVARLAAAHRRGARRPRLRRFGRAARIRSSGCGRCGCATICAGGGR